MITEPEETRPPEAGLHERLHRHLARSGLLPAGRGVMVALSGGLDSIVLLDVLLRLRPRWDWRIVAGHFDHRMRPDSVADARWVARQCERLGVPLRTGHADPAPRNETEARTLRYRWLERTGRELEADRIVTAHHADDQAETVLLRILRGTGITGLRGIRERRGPAIVRPLLPFWREELETYAAARELQWREDPTNRDTRILRNRVRHELIPRIERDYAAGFRRHLHRLSRQAAAAGAALERFVSDAADTLILESSQTRLVVARRGFLAYDTHARAQLLRHLVARIGPRPGRAGTRSALQFIRAGSSGSRIELSGGVVLRREFDRLILERARADDGAVAESRPLRIAGPDEGEGQAILSGRRWRVKWGRSPGPTADALCERFAVSALEFPLTLRVWEPGDRIRLPAGRRKLKKVFVDRRIGRSERRGYPVLADGLDVLWVAGLVRSERGATVDDGGEVFTICLRPES